MIEAGECGTTRSLENTEVIEKPKRQKQWWDFATHPDFRACAEAAGRKLIV